MVESCFACSKQLWNFRTNLYLTSCFDIEQLKRSRMESVMGRFNLFMPLYSINYALLDPIVSYECVSRFPKGKRSQKGSIFRSSFIWWRNKQNSLSCALKKDKNVAALRRGGKRNVNRIILITQLTKGKFTVKSTQTESFRYFLRFNPSINLHTTPALSFPFAILLCHRDFSSVCDGFGV